MYAAEVGRGVHTLKGTRTPNESCQVPVLPEKSNILGMSYLRIASQRSPYRMATILTRETLTSEKKFQSFMGLARQVTAGRTFS